MNSTTRRFARPVAVAATVTMLTTFTTAWGGAAHAEQSPSSEETQTYIAVSTGGVRATSALETTVNASGGADVTRYDSVGAAVATMTAQEAAALDARPGVVVAADTRIQVDPRQGADLKALGDVRASATAMSWGLDRIDQRTAALDGQYTTPTGVDGAGVHVWVFDSGIALNHPEFAGRIGTSYDFVGDGYGANDCYGHGTHVAGTIGSRIFGVAPKATLHAVRILDCDGAGYTSDFVAALDRVAAVAPPASVANASLGGFSNAAVNAAVANFIATARMPMVVAAGNDAEDVAMYSPASTPEATTVAATERIGGEDYEADYTNYGAGVDVFAPGTDIWSTYYGDPTKKLRLSGTSMAAPHVAGYFALYFAINPNATVAQAQAALQGQATTGMVRWTTDATPNRLLYTRALSRPVAKKKVTVRVAKSGYGNVLMVDVNPDRGSASYAFRVQKRSASGSWSTLPTAYTTVGATETKSLTLAAGTYRVLVPETATSTAATSTAVTLTAPTAKVAVSANSARSKLVVNVNPDKGSGFWSFRVQKRAPSGLWSTTSTRYTTKGSAETRTINLKAGTYRVVVTGKYGYKGVTSSPVTLVK